MFFPSLQTRHMFLSACFHDISSTDFVAKPPQHADDDPRFINPSRLTRDWFGFSCVETVSAAGVTVPLKAGESRGFEVGAML